MNARDDSVVSDEEDEHKTGGVKRMKKKDKDRRQAAVDHKDGRIRPTNNQLLYKVIFKWEHYDHPLLDQQSLPVETDPCASVTTAFLQVLKTLQDAEAMRRQRTNRSILQMLSKNTRKTKVVELSSGTHRVPEEIKKHYLSDEYGGQYSTNLDRNRYGSDDNYLFTVIRYDLDFLGLCPLLIDVEIVDVKAHNSSTLVTAGEDACKCKEKHKQALPINGQPNSFHGFKPLGASHPMASAPTMGGPATGLPQLPRANPLPNSLLHQLSSSPSLLPSSSPHTLGNHNLVESLSTMSPSLAHALAPSPRVGLSAGLQDMGLGNPTQPLLGIQSMGLSNPAQHVSGMPSMGYGNPTQLSSGMQSMGLSNPAQPMLGMQSIGFGHPGLGPPLPNGGGLQAVGSALGPMGFGTHLGAGPNLGSGPMLGSGPNLDLGVLQCSAPPLARPQHSADSSAMYRQAEMYRSAANAWGLATAPQSQLSPKPSMSGVSQLFDALLMATAADGDGVNAVTSSLQPHSQGLGYGTTAAAAAALGGMTLPASLLVAGAASPSAGLKGVPHHPAPHRNISRLWSALSFGADMDSLQNALDNFRGEEEIVSNLAQAGKGTSCSPAPAVGGPLPLAPGTGTPTGGPEEGGALPPAPRVGGTAGGPEEGGTAAASDAAAAEPSGTGPEGEVRVRRRKPLRGNSSFHLLKSDSLGFGFSGLSKLGSLLGKDESGDLDAVCSGGPPPAAAPTESSGEAEAGGEVDNTAEKLEEAGGESGAMYDQKEEDEATQQQRARSVPRQSSAANLSSRLTPDEVRGLRVELATLRSENRRLKLATAGGATSRTDLRGSGDNWMKACPPPSPLGSGGGNKHLEREIAFLRNDLAQARADKKLGDEQLEAFATELRALYSSKQRCEECVRGLTLELAKSRQEVHLLLTRIVGGSAVMQAAGLPTPSANESQALASNISQHLHRMYTNNTLKATLHDMQLKRDFEAGHHHSPHHAPPEVGQRKVVVASTHASVRQPSGVKVKVESTSAEARDNTSEGGPDVRDKERPRQDGKNKKSEGSADVRHKKSEGSTDVRQKDKDKKSEGAESRDKKSKGGESGSRLEVSLTTNDMTKLHSEATTAGTTTAHTADLAVQPTAATTAHPTAELRSVATTAGAPSAQCLLADLAVQPTAASTAHPTAVLAGQPTAATTAQPTADLAGQPTAATTAQPTADLAVQPTAATTTHPKADLAVQPTTATTAHPTADLAGQPTAATTAQPTADLAVQPTAATTTSAQARRASPGAGEKKNLKGGGEEEEEEAKGGEKGRSSPGVGLASVGVGVAGVGPAGVGLGVAGEAVAGEAVGGEAVAGVCDPDRVCDITAEDAQKPVPSNAEMDDREEDNSAAQHAASTSPASCKRSLEAGSEREAKRPHVL